MVLNDDQRDLFDGMLQEEIAALPDDIRQALEEVPIVVDDQPSETLLAEMGLPSGQTLCGLHSGFPLTSRSREISGVLPTIIQLFRVPIFTQAGYSRSALQQQIHITLLHEIGHYFGLDEDDLERLGYG